MQDVSMCARLQPTEFRFRSLYKFRERRKYYVVVCTPAERTSRPELVLVVRSEGITNSHCVVHARALGISRFLCIFV